MRIQSATYDPFTPTRTVDMVVSFGLINERAKDIAVSSASGTANRTSGAQTLNRDYSSPQNWATFEKNGWILGGENKILPSDSSGVELGWWSEIDSDENGIFPEPPYLLFAFSEPMTTYGWSLFFDAKNKIHATAVRFTTYASDGATQITTRTFANTEDALYASYIAEDYNYVKVEFLSLNEPYRKVRLAEIDFGLTQHFNKDMLVKATLIEEADIIARALPSRQLTFTFDNSTKIYNMLKPDLLYNYFSSGSAISAKIIINGEDVDMGSFFFTSAATKSNALTADITANDVMVQIGKQLYSHEKNEEMTLREAVDIILEGFEIERIYNGGAGDTLVNLSTAASVSRREMLRQLAQAAMCTCYINRDGQMMFTNLITADEHISAIDKHALYNYNGISVSDPVTKIKLTANDPTTYGGIRSYEAGEGTNVVEVENPCVHDSNGSAVAQWLLEGYNRRISYKVKNRCDPAVEVGDTVKLDDTYGENLNAAVTGIDIRYNGGIYANTEAVI